MTDAITPHAHVAVRASDAEREQSVALLQRSFADGRLTLGELEERAAAAYAARTRAQLSDLTADLPAAEPPRRSRATLDTRLMCILCICPPAGLAYWLLSVRQTAHLRTRLMIARRWQQLLAGAMVAAAGAALEAAVPAGAGPALEVLSHLAGAVLVSAGVIVAMPAISRVLHRLRRRRRSVA
jgi:hypothetical protein